MLEKLSKNDADNPLGSAVTESESSWISSILIIGCIIGPFIYSNLIDKIGRKYAILGTGVPLAAGYLMISFTKSIKLLYVGRFLCGLGTGGVFNVIPLYIAEIAHNKNRGALSSMLTVFSCSGTLFSYCFGPFMNFMTFNTILAIFPIIFLISFHLIGPESVYYDIRKGKYDSAEMSIQRLRGNSVEAKEELGAIQKTIKEAGEETFVQVLRNRVLRKALYVVIGHIIFQQLSGITAFLYYSQTIFEQAGVDLEPAFCSIIFGSVQFATSLATPVVVDRLGRKKLFIISAAGMAISEAPLGTYYYLKDNNYNVSFMSLLPVVGLIFFVVSFNIGYGPLPTIIMGELFPTNAKSIAALFAIFFGSLSSFLIAKYFSIAVNSFGMGVVLWFFSISCGLAIPFTHLCLMETKGKKLQEIQEELAQ